MKLKCQNPLMSLLGKASAVALENMASEVPSFTLSFFPLLFWRWFRQRQARSQILPDLPSNSFIFLNAIAIWNRTISLCYSYKSPLSYTTTRSSHRNFLTNLSRMKQWRAVFSPPCPPCPHSLRSRGRASSPLSPLSPSLPDPLVL